MKFGRPNSNYSTEHRTRTGPVNPTQSEPVDAGDRRSCRRLTLKSFSGSPTFWSFEPDRTDPGSSKEGRYNDRGSSPLHFGVRHRCPGTIAPTVGHCYTRPLQLWDNRTLYPSPDNALHAWTSARQMVLVGKWNTYVYVQPKRSDILGTDTIPIHICEYPAADIPEDSTIRYALRG